jgi:hypothetical protein
MAIYLQFPAGRSVRREGTTSIDPIPRYGYLQLVILTYELFELSELISTGLLFNVYRADWQGGSTEGLDVYERYDIGLS